MNRNKDRIALLLAAAFMMPLTPWPAAEPADAAPNPCAQSATSSNGSQPGTTQPAANQIEAVTLAHGIKPSHFIPGDVTPVQPTNSFISTDVPYAVVKVHTVCPASAFVVRLLDLTGATFEVQGTPPTNENGPLKTFVFVFPLYLLGTDLEAHYGSWHVNVLVDGEMVRDVPFQWIQATDKSLGPIRDLVNASPMDADAHWRYGAALAQLGHDEEAIQEVQTAIRINPRYALYYITLGRIYEREGRKAEAISNFQKALTIHGSYYDSVFSSWAQADLQRVQQ